MSRPRKPSPLKRCRRCKKWPATQGRVCGHCLSEDILKFERRSAKVKGGPVYGKGEGK